MQHPKCATLFTAPKRRAEADGRTPIGSASGDRRGHTHPDPSSGQSATGSGCSCDQRIKISDESGGERHFDPQISIFFHSTDFKAKEVSDVVVVVVVGKTDPLWATAAAWSRVTPPVGHLMTSLMGRPRKSHSSGTCNSAASCRRWMSGFHSADGPGGGLRESTPPPH